MKIYNIILIILGFLLPISSFASSIELESNMFKKKGVIINGDKNYFYHYSPNLRGNPVRKVIVIFSDKKDDSVNLFNYGNIRTLSEKSNSYILLLEPEKNEWSQNSLKDNIENITKIINFYNINNKKADQYSFLGYKSGGTLMNHYLCNQKNIEVENVVNLFGGLLNKHCSYKNIKGNYYQFSSEKDIVSNQNSAYSFNDINNKIKSQKNCEDSSWNNITIKESNGVEIIKSDLVCKNNETHIIHYKTDKIFWVGPTNIGWENSEKNQYKMFSIEDIFTSKKSLMW